jgi:hypothetical protein
MQIQYGDGAEKHFHERVDMSLFITKKDEDFVMMWEALISYQICVYTLGDYSIALSTQDLV